ncbi:class I SAM-dependent methyltransferase [Thermoproteota archaeon]
MAKKPKKTWTLSMAKAWGKFIPFARPSKSELAVFDRYYKRIFKRFKSKKENKSKIPKSLVLGATAEFRDLALKNGFDSYCIDISKKNFIQLRSLMKKKRLAAKKEKFIHSDWVHLKTDNKFDIIVGDWSTNMLPPGKLDAFFRAVKKHLTKDGMLLDRHGVWLPSDRKKVNIKKQVADYRKKYQKMNFFPVKGLEIFKYFFDWRKKCVSLYTIMYGLDDLLEKGILSKKEYNDMFFMDVQRHTGFCISILMKKDYEKKAKKHLKIVKEEYGKDIFKKNLPIYIIKLK